MKLTGVGLVLMATSVFAQDRGAVSVERAACGAPETTFSVKSEPSRSGNGAASGEARVYLLEVQDHVGFCPFGCGVTVKLGMDGEWAGATSGNSFLEMPVAAGDHHLCVAWQSKLKRLRKHLELAGFSAESGKVYYFRVHITPGTTETIESFRLEPVNADEGKLLVASLPESVWTKK